MKDIKLTAKDLEQVIGGVSEIKFECIGQIVNGKLLPTCTCDSVKADKMLKGNPYHIKPAQSNPRHGFVEMPMGTLKDGQLPGQGNNATK